MRHQHRKPPIGRGQTRDALRRTVGIVRIVLGRGTPVIDKAQGNQRLRPAALPGSGEFGIASPCATAIGSRLPAMASKNNDGDSTTSTIA